MAKTYLFYDLETSGINKCFDQIMQFAAIRTDIELNEIERYEFLVKLNPDTIIDPQALIVHHIPIHKANKDGIAEYEAAQKIHELMNVPDTISIGYNTLGFDDEFLRFTFHRNLLSPYTHQYANNCYRMDLYPMLAMYYLYDNGRLAFPIKDNKTSLKLEFLNQVNQFVVNGRAHDAMVDVEVTLGLARVLKSNSPMWGYLEGCFNKSKDEKVIDKLNAGVTIKGKDYKQALMVNGIFGADNFYHAPVLNLGQHRKYKNQTCWLRLDLPELRETKEIDILEKCWIQKKKWGEPPMLLPVKGKYIQNFTADRIKEIKKNKQWIKENSDLFLSIVEESLESTYPKVNNIDVDASLYSSDFMKNWEQRLCGKFHDIDLQGKINMLKDLEGSIRDRAVRILGRLDSELLLESFREDFCHYMEQVTSFDESDLLVDYKGHRKRSVPDTFDKIQELRENLPLSREQIQLLDELEDYIAI
jgi:exodeoxyribonuclease I